MIKSREDPKPVNGALIIAGIAGGILILWFLLGFVLPVVMFKNGYVAGGTFGDSFGSVNALFSGLGFLALSYTIYLQIRNAEEQKRQEKFSLYLKLFDEIKEDLDNIEFIGTVNSRGINCIEVLKMLVKPDRYDSHTKNNLKRYFKFLFNINSQILNLLYMIRTDKMIYQNERELIEHKLLTIHLVYLSELYSVIIKQDYEEFDFRNLKLSCSALKKALREFIGSER